MGSMRSRCTPPAATPTRGIYYYTTYENRQITAVDMRRENLNGSALIRYPMITDQQIAHQN